MMQGQSDRNHTSFPTAVLWLLFSGMGIVFIGGTVGLRYHYSRRINAWEQRARRIDVARRSSSLYDNARRAGQGLTWQEMETALGVRLLPDKQGYARVNVWQSNAWFLIQFDDQGKSYGVVADMERTFPPPKPPITLLILEQARAYIDCFGWILWMLLAFLAAALQNQRRALMWVALAVALLHLVAVALVHFGWVSSPTVDLHSAGWAISGILIVLTLGTLFPTLPKRSTEPLCPECGYNLTGNESGVCPECGQPILPALRQAIHLAAGEPDPETIQAVERLEQLQSNQPERSVDP